MSLQNKIDQSMSDEQGHKIVYLIRHGESQGQAARGNGLDRKRDKSLIDAGLTRRGTGQAKQIPYLLEDGVVSSIQLVVSSPLTRALHTALLGFGDECNDECSFLVHYDLKEVGRIPENVARPMKQVLRDLDFLPSVDKVDHQSLMPPGWPDTSNNKPHHQKIQDVMVWLAQEREERVIAVVCHFNIIQAALGPDTHAENALPIACGLTSDGTLYRLQTAHEENSYLEQLERGLSG